MDMFLSGMYLPLGILTEKHKRHYYKSFCGYVVSPSYMNKTILNISILKEGRIWTIPELWKYVC